MSSISVCSPAWRGWYVAAVGAVSSAVLAAAISQFSATLLPLAEQIGVTKGRIALSDSFKSAAIVVAMLLAPILIKKCGRMGTYILAILCFLIPQVFIPYAASYSFLIFMKVVQGFSSLLFPLLLIVIIESNERRNVGFATAIFTGIFYAGSAVGGSIASVAILLSGWQFSYHILSILLIVLSLVFLMTVPLKDERLKKGELRHPAKKGSGAYRAVVTNRITWYLVAAFLPTIWTMQAISADIVPFGHAMGYSDTDMGGIMGVSAAAILISALISGKVSDFFAANHSNKLGARAAVLAAGSLLICIGIFLVVTADLKAPNQSLFYTVAFLLSFGAAWGLGAFYCVIPEAFSGEGVTVANAFAGGVADMAMPLSPVVMAVVGIEMHRWGLAWVSCAAVGVLGVLFAVLIIADSRKRSVSDSSMS